MALADVEAWADAAAVAKALDEAVAMACCLRRGLQWPRLLQKRWAGVTSSKLGQMNEDCIKSLGTNRACHKIRLGV